MYDFYMGKNLECYNTASKRRFLDTAERFENILKHSGNVFANNMIINKLGDAEVIIQNELG